MDPVLGIDLSEHNWRGGVPFGMLPKLNAKGVRFLIGRASIGTRVDPSFEPNRHRGTFRSWVPGGYHYLVDSIDPKDQAETFIGECRRTGGMEGLITVLDVEDDNRPPILNHPSLKAVRSWAREFKDAHPHHQLGVYSNQATWFRLGNPDVTDLGFDFVWNAYWPRGVNTPADLPDRPPLSFGGEGRAKLWQWGSLEVKGASGNTLHLDGNAWYGSMDALRDLATRDRPPIPERPAYRAAYNATVDASLAAIQALTAPAGAPPAALAGHDAAKEAAIDAVQALRLEEVKG